LIRSTRGLVFAGLIAAVIGLIVLFPARVAYELFAPDSIKAAGIRGTIWNGSVREAGSNGIYLGAVSWSAHPVRLFTGELALDVSASPASGFFESRVGLRPGGRVTLHEVRASIPLLLFAQAVNVRGLAGTANVAFDYAEIVNSLPVAIDGFVEIKDLVSPVVLRDGSLGSFRAEFFTRDDGVIASVEDTDAVIDLAGSLEIRRDRSYRFIAQVVARDNTPQALRDQMRFLPPADERGRHELRVEGTL